MEKHQEQLAKNGDVNSAESLHRLSKEIFGSTRKKSSQKHSCHFIYSGRLFQEVCNNLWKNCVYCRESVMRVSMSALIFPLHISVICISFCHLAAKSPGRGYICHSTLHAAFLLPLPPAHSRIPSQYSLLSPQPSAYLTALNRTVPMQSRRGVTLAHRYTKQ